MDSQRIKKKTKIPRITDEGEIPRNSCLTSGEEEGDSSGLYIYIYLYVYISSSKALTSSLVPYKLFTLN